jgi:cell division transport system ATP-binding protein
VVKFTDITKTFGKISALSDINFEVDDGEFVFIAGPSGSGKTTLLRLLIRELMPDKGRIIVDRQDITVFKDKEVPYLRQKIGVVFQDFKVLPERTVRENVEVALAVVGVPQKEWQARVDRVLEEVGLKDRSELFPSQLSGGELQRVSLARALVVNPKIVIADEPTGNLDWDTADEIMSLFEKINKAGKTVFVASHHKAIIKKMAKRVIELNKGRIVSDTKNKKENK